MKKLLLTLCLASSVLAGSAMVHAMQPPPRKTLAERVDLASHVIVGTAKKVRVVQFIDGKLQEVQPEPKLLEKIFEGEHAQVEIEVEEVLYPSGWKPKKTIRYLFGGGFFEVESIRSDTVGKKRIYLMKALTEEERKALKDNEGLFFPSYEWHLAESIERKAEIGALLEARIKREAEAKEKEKEAKTK